MFLPLRRASAEFHESTEGLAAAARALALIGLPALALGTGGGEPPDPLEVPVRLCSVTVGFPARDAPVLAGASLVIDPGETVVLVGQSGAGKSTVISLLLGFIAPCSGSVIAGGLDLARFDPDQWRRHLTYLPEHPTLLAGTLAENLRLANAAATEAELAEALARAGAVDLLARLPHGLATPIGEGGRPVSAGERQRIALARVFLRPRSLYLLDEPTVHLDGDGEAGVLESLRSELAGRSALIVSHRPAVLSLADRVVVLADGEARAPRQRADGRGARMRRPRAPWAADRPTPRQLVPTVGAGVVGATCAVGLLATSGWLITRASQRPPVLSLCVAIGAVQAFSLGRGLARTFSGSASTACR